MTVLAILGVATVAFVVAFLMGRSYERLLFGASSQAKRGVEPRPKKGKS